MSQEITNDLQGAVAIIGLAGRFPKAKDLEAFWKNLINKEEAVSFYSKAELLEAGVDPNLVKDPHYVPAHAALEDVEYFDANFFGYSPREAQIIDPQQRLFLECAWEALENAGYDPERFSGTIGVYGGQSMNSYLMNNIVANQETVASAGWYQVMLGNDKDFLTTRVSYKLNLRGPSLNIQTACSTSLVAVHEACQNLLNYQCDMALAGGVSAQAERKTGYLYQPGMIMSPDGHCRAFDHRAQGIVGGEGVGIVVLKRYSEAIKAGDTIHAIIRGSAINNDGGVKVGYTAPSVNGQAEVILMAQAVSGVDPNAITYIETHGTGTDLGDPIEINALTQAFRSGTQEKGYCAISSVKTHMGHLDAAAGIANLITTILAIQHRTLPPNLHFEKPNPHIDFENSPFYVNTTASPWETDRLPRRAGVSAFGIGGTNAHVIVEEPQPAPEAQVIHPHQLLVLSARSETALQAARKNLAECLRQRPTEHLANVAYTLQVGRSVFKHRLAWVCQTAQEAVEILEDLGSRRVSAAQQTAKDTPVIFLFSGQGAQYVQMGRDLYECEPYFREQVDQCAEILKPHLGLDLRSVLYPTLQEQQKAEDLLQQTWITQPALFTIEYALAKLWMHWGVHPKAMVGHSIGEYTAACLANVFTLADALALVAARGQLMQSLPGGSMLSVPLSEDQIRPFLNQSLSLAVINAPEMCVVSGPHEAIDQLQAELTTQGIACRKLRTSHAFHSAMMDPILAAFTERVGQVSRKTPEIPLLSNLTGGWMTAEQAADPAYWAAHLRSTVRFAQNVETLSANPAILLEVGPGTTLASLARQHPKVPANQATVSSLRHPQEPSSDTAFITNTLGKLWLAGATLDWNAYHQNELLRRIPLPTYPFERKRYWLEKSSPAVFTGEIKKPVRKQNDLSNWFYIPTWQRTAWPARASVSSQKQSWLLFCDAMGVGSALAQQLEAEGQSVVTVQAGAEYHQNKENSFSLQSDRKEQVVSLFSALAAQNFTPAKIIHLQTITGPRTDTLEDLNDIQTKGFYSLLAIAQALGEFSQIRPLDLLVVSDHLHQVTGAETVQAGKATLLGPCKVIPQEFPGITCRSLDIVLPDSSELPGKPLLEQILAESNAAKTETVVAQRGPYRWAQTYLPNPLPPLPEAENTLPLRQQGVYLITGGYGGIGLAIAGHLAKTYQARLILVGRSGLPEKAEWADWLAKHAATDEISRRISALLEMESQGAAVLTLKADAANREQMKAAIDTARKTFGSIHGVVHAAGIAGGGVIQLKTPNQAAQVLAPKVAGAWIIDHLLDDEQLDFILLCSSINAAIGSVGQVDYSAANAYLDAFSSQKSAANKKTRVRSVNWAAWQEVGMALDTAVPASMLKWKEENLRNGIPTSQGIEAFRRILANGEPQVLVSPLDFSAILTSFSSKEETAPESHRNARSDPEHQEGTDQSPAPVKLLTANELPTNDIEAKLAEIWQDVIGYAPIGIHENFFELGGHSLMAIQILSRIRDIYRIEPPLGIFFEANTIADLGKRIDAMLWIEQNKLSVDSPSDDREEISL